MSSFCKPNVLLKQCDAAIAKGRVVKKGSDVGHAAVCSAASDKMYGINQSDLSSGAAEDAMEVAVAGGGAQGLSGGTVSMGDQLTSDANGALVATTTAGERYIATAMDDAVSGDIFDVFVQPGIV